MEYGRQGIRINVVCPGLIDTPMGERLLLSLSDDPEVRAREARRSPLGRMGTPREVASAVLWLCSDAASFIHGHALPIEGGSVAQ